MRQHCHILPRLTRSWGVRTSPAEVLQRTGYYSSETPYLLPDDLGGAASTGMTLKTDRLHIGNRWMGHSGLGWYDNTARMHDPLLMHFTTPDPLYGRYGSTSPWAHCAANPANAIDPDGCRIMGMKGDDMHYFYAQVENVLSDKKFTEYLSAIKIKGCNLKFDKKADIQSIIGGIEMSDDEAAFVNILTDAISNKRIMAVEYYVDDPISDEGQSIIYQAASVSPMLQKNLFSDENTIGRNAVSLGKGGTTTSTRYGSYSLIDYNMEESRLPLYTFHEVLGHGMSFIYNTSHEENNSNGIRVENVVRSILGLDKWDGSGHAEPFRNPESKPIFK